MKLPIPFLLYVMATGLFGLAGWTVYRTLPLLKKETKSEATDRGTRAGMDLTTKGKGQNTTTLSWRYTSDSAPWWAGFKSANLTGKLPPPPAKPDGPDPSPPPPVVDVRPLADLIELVSLVYDGQSEGKGGDSHVIVRFKTEANVELPEWYVRENSPPAPASGATQPLAAQPARDVAPNRGGARPAPAAGNGTRPAPRGPSTMPATMNVREALQKVWVRDDGDPRRTAVLWTMKPASLEPGKGTSVITGIRLVRVAADAQSAFFTREVPSPEPGQPPIQREDELIKTSMNLSQDLLQELRRLQGRSTTASGAASAPAPALSWLDVEETTMVGKVRHIGRKDEKRFRDSDDIFDQLNVDTYVSKTTGRRGLIVRGVDAQLAASFGVAAGDVLLEVNGQKVESKAQAISLGKAQYKRGVRTFVTKWLSNGVEVERTYQASDK